MVRKVTVTITVLLIVNCQTEEPPPRLECLDDGLRLHLRPDLPFCGHVYVKGYFLNARCHLDLTNHPINSAFYFHVPYRSDCSIRRERSMNPPGVFYRVVIVIQHHKLFLTAVDKAYSVSCFYEEVPDRLTQQIQVGDIPANEISGRLPLPSCTYEIVDAHERPAKYASVGDRLMHRWKCESDTHGVLVHNCLVHNGIGKQFEMIDERGCVVDSALIDEPQYSTSLNSATASFFAFKFADDQLAVQFACQITLCRRIDNGCEGISPPVCRFLPLPSSNSTTSPESTIGSIPIEPSGYSPPPSPSSHPPTVYGVPQGVLLPFEPVFLRPRRGIKNNSTGLPTIDIAARQIIVFGKDETAQSSNTCSVPMVNHGSSLLLIMFAVLLPLFIAALILQRRYYENRLRTSLCLASY